jgi:hypothetical protein
MCSASVWLGPANSTREKRHFSKRVSTPTPPPEYWTASLEVWWTWTRRNV